VYTNPIFGTFALSSLTQTAGTVIVAGVPPFRGKAGTANRYQLSTGKPNWLTAFTHLTQLVYTAAGTAHDVVVMRPLNWATIAADVAANATAITLDWNPGTYSANYKYDLPADANGKPSAVADNNIAANDYVAYQLRDGTWVFDKVASVSGLTLTMTTATPNVTGGGVEAGTALFFFGVAADSDPATGKAHLTINSVASARTDLLNNYGGGTISTLHPGDPLLIYSANATAAGVLSLVTGFYGGN